MRITGTRGKRVDRACQCIRVCKILPHPRWSYYEVHYTPPRTSYVMARLCPKRRAEKQTHGREPPQGQQEFLGSVVGYIHLSGVLWSHVIYSVTSLGQWLNIERATIATNEGEFRKIVILKMGDRSNYGLPHLLLQEYTSSSLVNMLLNSEISLDLENN